MADQAEPVAASRLAVPSALAATIVLVRHGESTFVAEGRFQGRQDPPLSSLGKRQAELAGNRLANRSVPVPLAIPTGPPIGIWHSPLSRAAETASIIGGRQPDGVALWPHPDLTEIAQGDWEGKLLPEVKAGWADELAAWRTTPATAHAPGGEALPVAAERVAKAVGDVVAALAAAAGIAPDKLAQPLGFDPVPGYAAHDTRLGATSEPWAVLVAHDGIFRLVLMTLLAVPLERFWSFPFNLASITIVALNGGVAALRAHNLGDHLAPLTSSDERSAREVRSDRGGAL